MLEYDTPGPDLPGNLPAQSKTSAEEKHGSPISTDAATPISPSRRTGAGASQHLALMPPSSPVPQPWQPGTAMAEGTGTPEVWSQLHHPLN